KVGSLQNEEVDIRFISATDKDLIVLMREGRFREQLYHRLRECEIYIPPLSERREDIPEIINHYCQKHNNDFSEYKFFSNDTIDFLTDYAWRGNVRELVNFLKLILQTTQKDKIEISDVKKVLSSNHYNSVQYQIPVFATDRTLKEDLAEVDKKKIEATLAQCNGNVSKSAALLGVSRETLHNKIRRYNIDVSIFRKKN
ncbi:MAG TPA: helix-turn-helix domain-containing protein, partial [Candidatus Kapabacteria bacterium]|nr:helix-turn-helix domain-containing protein [Candidatus Kapabacteria bacterium]